MNPSLNATADQIIVYLEDFREHHDKFVATGVKSSASKARKAIGEMRKLVTQYRQLSIEAVKSMD